MELGQVHLQNAEVSYLVDQPLVQNQLISSATFSHYNTALCVIHIFLNFIPHVWNNHNCDLPFSGRSNERGPMDLRVSLRIFKIDQWYLSQKCLSQTYHRPFSRVKGLVQQLVQHIENTIFYVNPSDMRDTPPPIMCEWSAAPKQKSWTPCVFLFWQRNFL